MLYLKGPGGKSFLLTTQLPLWGRSSLFLLRIPLVPLGPELYVFLVGGEFAAAVITGVGALPVLKDSCDQPSLLSLTDPHSSNLSP